MEELEISAIWGTEAVGIKVGVYGFGYGCGKNLYIGLTAMEYGYQKPYAHVTRNTFDRLPDYHAYLDVSNVLDLGQFVEGYKLGVKTGDVVYIGPVGHHLYVFDPERLRELCPVGLGAYEKERGIRADKKKRKEKGR